jgi:hypothetical protein
MLAHEIDVLWVPTHPPNINFCSSSSKAKHEAIQEISDNTIVDPCSNLPNESMLPYLAVPTYLMVIFVKFFTSSWSVERWNLSSMSLLHSLFLKSIRENMITMIQWFLNIRHSGTLFGMWFLTLAQTMFHSSYSLKAKYVELMGKECWCS